MILVVRLSAPMLAWPSASRFRHRLTEAVPTMSALQGILAAAAGVRREDSRPSWISEANMAVRLDLPGSVQRDFQTINPSDQARYWQLSARDQDKVRTVAKANGAEHDAPVITKRFYRQDQTVLWFIDDAEGKVQKALDAPVFNLYAGRKACPFSVPFQLGLVGGDLEDALSTFPTLAPPGVLVEGSLFAKPTKLAQFKVPERRADKPTGQVGLSYALQDRFSVLVDPPRAASWFEVVETLRSGDDVAH